VPEASVSAQSAPHAMPAGALVTLTVPVPVRVTASVAVDAAVAAPVTVADPAERQAERPQLAMAPRRPSVMLRDAFQVGRRPLPRATVIYRTRPPRDSAQSP
jgi:hypothetical protein